MKNNIGQKANRFLRFLLGLRNPAVATALTRYGFTPDDLQKGWRLLSALTHGRLDVVAPVPDGLVTEIDAWENTWLPVTKATLDANAPDASAMVFANITRTQGPAVVVTVGTFIERVERLGVATSKGGLGKEGAHAQKLLAKRGLTTAELKRAKALIARAATMAEAAAEVPSTDEAEQAMWSWYLEWSGIARVAIRDRRTLRSLGFAKMGRPAATPVVPTQTKPLPALPQSAVAAPAS